MRGNTVAAWVAKVDPGAARNTADVDLMVDRADFDAVKTAMENAGFIHRRLGGVDMFLDGPTERPRDAVHIVFAGEKVHADYPAPTPDLSAAESHETCRLLDLKPLVTMKLTSFRDKERTHLRDLIEVSLIGRDWLDRLPSELAERLQYLLDTSEG